MKRRIALEASKTLAVYGFAGWVYIALVALVHPHTLGLQLTHFTSFPHEDTFGETCFVVSLVSFFCYNLLRAAQPERGAASAACRARPWHGAGPARPVASTARPSSRDRPWARAQATAAAVSPRGSAAATKPTTSAALAPFMNT